MAPIIIAIVGGAVLCLAIGIFHNRRPALFTSRVSGALYDLGLQVLKFDSKLNQLYLSDCQSYYEKDPTRANPYEMACRFFVKALLDYSAFAERAVMFDSIFIRSIKVVRSWQGEKISADSADHFIKKIKISLIEGIKDQSMETAEKLAREIHILA